MKDHVGPMERPRLALANRVIQSEKKNNEKLLIKLPFCTPAVREIPYCTEKSKKICAWTKMSRSVRKSTNIYERPYM